MILLAVLALLLTLGFQVLAYMRSKDHHKLFISLGLLLLLVAFSGVSILLRSMPPLFYLHMALIVFAWGGLIFYMIRDKLYWWSHVAPLGTLLLYLLLEEIMGSGHDFF